MKCSKRRIVSLILCLSALGAMVMSGCIVVPVKMKTRIEGPAGTKVNLPTEALVAGATTRVEVDARYKDFAVQTDIPNFFWGRFRKSSWAIVFAAGGGYGGGMAGGGRSWGVHNLLIIYDSNGVVKTFEDIPDKDLQRHLKKAAKELSAPPLDLTDPIKTGGTFPGERALDLELTSTGMTASLAMPWLNRKKPAPAPKVAVVPVENIARVDVGKRFDDKSTELGVTLHFTQKTALGKSLSFSAGPNEGLTLMRWLEQLRQEKTPPANPQK